MAWSSASLAGAGADATNTILTTTRAFLLDSDVTSAGDVDVTATGDASIEAIVVGFSAAISIGAGSLAVAIGISLARNLIGWNPAKYDATSDETRTGLDQGTRVLVVTGNLAGNIYEYKGSGLTGSVDLRSQTYTDTTRWTLVNGADNTSDDTLTTNLVAGRTVRIASGPGAGDVFRYIGPTVTGSAGSPIFLNTRDYRDTSLWTQLNLTSSPAVVSATTTRTSIDAAGDLRVTATSTASIVSHVFALSAAVSVGMVGGGLGGAGSASTNMIRIAVAAVIDGDGTDGIVADSITVKGSDDSHIKAITIGAALSVGGAFAGATTLAIGVAIANNAVSSTLDAGIRNADDVTVRGGDIRVTATSAAETPLATIAAATTLLALLDAASATRNAQSEAEQALDAAETAAALAAIVTLLESLGYTVSHDARNLSLTPLSEDDSQLTSGTFDRWLFRDSTSRAYVLERSGSTVTVSELTIDAVVVAASVALSISGFASMAVSAAGAHADNSVLSKTHAFIESSDITDVDDVVVEASSSANIAATILGDLRCGRPRLRRLGCAVDRHLARH